MEDHHQIPPPLTPTFSWPFFWEEQEESEMEQLKEALLRTTLELESTRLIARDEIKNLESQSLHLARLLEIATRERDEARRHCHALLLYLSTNPNPNPNPDESTNDPPPPPSSPSSSSEEQESSSTASPPATAMSAVEAAAKERGLPEKGRLVEAVMKAGPLLKTLLVAGPLPQWRHPPPAMRSFEIPPVSISLNPNYNENEEKDGRKKKRERELERDGVGILTSSPESNGSSKYLHQEETGCIS